MNFLFACILIGNLKGLMFSLFQNQKFGFFQVLFKILFLLLLSQLNFIGFRTVSGKKKSAYWLLTVHKAIREFQHRLCLILAISIKILTAFNVTTHSNAH